MIRVIILFEADISYTNFFKKEKLTIREIIDGLNFKSLIESYSKRHLQHGMWGNILR